MILVYHVSAGRYITEYVSDNFDVVIRLTANHVGIVEKDTYSVTPKSWVEERELLSSTIRNSKQAEVVFVYSGADEYPFGHFVMFARATAVYNVNDSGFKVAKCSYGDNCLFKQSQSYNINFGVACTLINLFHI